MLSTHKSILATGPHNGIEGQKAAALLQEASHLWARVSGGLPASRVNRMRVGLCSTYPGEGVTTVATNLAIFLAQHDRQVAILESNLRSPGLAQHFGVRPSPGIWEYIEDIAKLTELPKNVAPNLSLVTAGAAPPNFSADFDQRRLGEITAHAEEHNDITILDAPPLSTAPESGLILQHADTVILVVQADRARKSDVQRSAQTLQELGVGFAGVVLNHVKYDVPTFVQQFL